MAWSKNSKVQIKPQLAYYVCPFYWMTFLRRDIIITNNSKLLCVFLRTWKMVENAIKACRRFFLCKINKNIQKNVLNSKLFNFITLWKLIKVPQNLVQGPSSVKFRKYALKTRIKISLQFPFNPSLPDPERREKINQTPFFHTSFFHTTFWGITKKCELKI